ncbi:MAG: Uma2 family endonuclease [Amaricoccus sp.]|uniref:Uma2 family endonuclease n=1 Tax=Amaricoccus sp. TaxID=1872485 RepID=UPI0039E5436E
MNERATIVRSPATYQDVLDAPPEMVAELVDGTLHLHPRPASKHSRASVQLCGRLAPLDGPTRGRVGWFFTFEPELHLGSDVLVPDLAGWRRERMVEFPDTPAFDLPPDWVCEILSPGTRRFDLTEKRALYGRWGVGHLWMLDPAAETLEAFELRESEWVLIGGFQDADEVRVAPFTEIGFPLSNLWPR